MQRPVNPPSKSTEVHVLIRRREWTHIRVLLNVPRLSDRASSSTATAAAASSSSATTKRRLSSSSSTSVQKALLQRDELGRTPLHLILHRRTGGWDMKKAPPDLIQLSITKTMKPCDY
jgi:hypothetical protein